MASQCLPAHSSSLCLFLPVLWPVWVRASEDGLQAHLRCGCATNANFLFPQGGWHKTIHADFPLGDPSWPQNLFRSYGHCPASRSGFPGSYWLSTDPDLKEIVRCALKKIFQSIFQTGSDHHSHRVPNIFPSSQVRSLCPCTWQGGCSELHNWALAVTSL